MADSMVWVRNKHARRTEFKWEGLLGRGKGREGRKKRKRGRRGKREKKRKRRRRRQEKSRLPLQRDSRKERAEVNGVFLLKGPLYLYAVVYATVV